MNKVILCGRLCADPTISNGGSGSVMVARYRLAVDRKYVKDGEQATDFIPCVVFGKNAEFAEKYLSKGKKIIVVGRIQTGSYTNKDGQKVYTTDVIVDEHEFCESKGTSSGTQAQSQPKDDEFMSLPDATVDSDLPFSK